MYDSFNFYYRMQKLGTKLMKMRNGISRKQETVGVWQNLRQVWES